MYTPVLYGSVMSRWIPSVYTGVVWLCYVKVDTKCIHRCCMVVLCQGGYQYTRVLYASVLSRWTPI